MARRTIAAFLLAVLLLPALPGCAGRRPGDVLVILRTKSYHTDACPKVRMANTRVMTIAEARGLNCEPCPGCAPGRGE
jgi:hypothetical protein